MPRCGGYTSSPGTPGSEGYSSALCMLEGTGLNQTRARTLFTSTKALGRASPLCGGPVPLWGSPSARPPFVWKPERARSGQTLAIVRAD